MIVREVIRQFAQKLSEYGVENARFEVTELLCHSGADRNLLYTEPNFELPDEVQSRAERLLERRLSGEPLQYLLGEWEFYGLPFKVGEGVLIPRQDTETLVETALDFLKKRPPKQRRVLDLCAGTGCIGIVLAKLANADVSCVELSGAAFGYLRENVRLNSVNSLVEPICGDIFDSEIRCGLGEFDLIVSNPPYLTKSDMCNLQAEVAREPKMALYGGSDGLDFYCRIVCDYAESVKINGGIAFEVGVGQSRRVAEMLSESGFAVNVAKDLRGIERVVYAIKVTSNKVLEVP